MIISEKLEEYAEDMLDIIEECFGESARERASEYSEEIVTLMYKVYLFGLEIGEKDV